MIEQVSPSSIIPPHEPNDPDKLSALVSSMEANGWQGAPIVVYEDMALCGSHRIAAAAIAEITVPVVDAVALWPDLADEMDEEAALWDNVEQIALYVSEIICRADATAQATYGLDLE